MNWLNRAEARFGYLAIPGLPYIIVGFHVLVYVLALLDPGFLSFINLNMAKVMQGQVWRLVTFLFIPQYGGLLPGPIGFAFYVLYLFYIGTGLERAMGAFQLTAYYFLGMVGIAVAATLSDAYPSNVLLNSTLLFAFARFYPDALMYIFFILPVRIKWIAWITAALLLVQFLVGRWDMRLAILAGCLNYVVFFGRDVLRDARHRREVSSRRARFDREVRQGATAPLHECAVCHRTEATPDLEFRIARDGEEYCLDHLPKSAPAG